MKRKLLAVLTAFSIVSAFGMVCQAEETDGTVVETAYGKVQGIESSNKKYEGVIEFRGIPYAAPPVGELRWQEPKDPEPWNDILICDTYKDIPMQVLGGAEVEPYKSDFYYDGVPQMSEDCLYLNIITKKENIINGEKKPVYVWFHGGGLNSCYTFEPEANGEAFAQNDIVVVTVEQRLGVFGYLSLPQLSDEQGQSGNYGLMDQIKALEWIKENIEAFGGDPNNITAGGQSGGTTKSMAMVISPECDVEVGKLILESGLKYSESYKTQEEAEAIGSAYLTDLGLDATISLDQLREMDAEDLMDTSSKNYPKSMNQDGLYVTYDSVRSAVEDGCLDSVSILSGTNLGEGSYPAASTAEEFYANYREALGDLYEKYDFENLVKVTDGTASEITRTLGTYGLGTNVSRSLMVNRLYGKLISERTDGQTKNYTYLFSHFTPESVSDIGTDRSRANQWAWHSSEMWYAFNSLAEGEPASRQWTEWDYELAEKMNLYWTNFINTGDPNGEGLTEWPQADEDMGYIVLGDGISSHKEPLTELEKLMEEYTAQYFGFPTVKAE
ncbi:MAG: carboxylesterase family protein [Robinsoniella sp.]|nr:carboxylesterase family protein [Robinsoniella sp.]